MANNLIRNRLKETGVYHWQLADLLGISEQTLCRRLRKELPPPERERILRIIDELRKEEC